MSKSKVAVLRTTPATVLRDYHDLLNLAGYQDVLPKDVDTALEINISWHFFFPGKLRRTGVRAFIESLRILWVCLKEAPEFGRRHRRIAAAPADKPAA